MKQEFSRTEPAVMTGEPIVYYENEAFDPAQDKYGSTIMVDSIHAGDYYPPELSEMFTQDDVLEAYVIEKDWGANYVARSLSKKLNLPGFYKVQLARAILDFGRFPGSTTSDVRNHMERRAINSPFSERLNYDQKKALLAQYDLISDVFDQALQNKVLKVAIHTYDKLNPAPIESERTIRPLTSIIYRSAAYQATNRMPFGTFDKLYIDELGEFSADRKLIARICLTLEKANVAVGQNYPYALPIGSVEVRAQVWSYFLFLQQAFREAHPEISQDIAFERVWTMLFDTNLRDGDSEIYRSYIHMYRRPPAGYELQCEAVKNAYYQIQKFVLDNEESLLKKYRWSPNRFNSIVFEVRKDYVWDFATGKPLMENVERVTTLLAQAITRYFEQDHIGFVIPAASLIPG